jgi:hypothetical protein
MCQNHDGLKNVRLVRTIEKRWMDDTPPSRAQRAAIQAYLLQMSEVVLRQLTASSGSVQIQGHHAAERFRTFPSCAILAGLRTLSPGTPTVMLPAHALALIAGAEIKQACEK